MLRRLLLASAGSGAFTAPPVAEGDEEMHGVRAKLYDGTLPVGQSIADQTFTALQFSYTGPASRCYDTDTYHPHNSESNLTGTVAKTSGSAVIVGTGTTFTSLSVGDAIRVAGGENSGYIPEVFVVQTITDNTHFTAYHTASASASGVTAVKDSTVFRVGPGLAGYYGGHASIGYRANTTGIREIFIVYNGMNPGFVVGGSNTNIDEQSYLNATSSGEFQNVMPWGDVYMDEGDYLQVVTYHNRGSSLQTAADLPGLVFQMTRRGV